DPPDLGRLRSPCLAPIALPPPFLSPPLVRCFWLIDGPSRPNPCWPRVGLDRNLSPPDSAGRSRGALTGRGRGSGHHPCGMDALRRGLLGSRGLTGSGIGFHVPSDRLSLRRTA